MLVFYVENDTVHAMSDYDGIRPYHDHEVPAIVARVLKNPELPRAASKLVLPPAFHGTTLGEVLTRLILKVKTRHLKSVYDVQMFLAGYFEKLTYSTVTDLSISGLDRLSPDKHYLFVSNHRDIVNDSSLLNFLIHKAGHETSRSAVGDNLLTNQLAADLMRLNKSFVVERTVTGAKATLQAMQRTSGYIRQSLEDGVSIWIAQREGRAKDGRDKTEPALLKMLALAHKDADDSLNALFERCDVVPVSVSYELDPCALRKAYELYMLDRDGEYDKSAQEDVESIVIGLIGQKGRVHLHCGEPISGSFETPEEAALAMDVAILRNMRVYPTHVEAAQRLGDTGIEPAEVPAEERVMRDFEAQIAACPAEQRDWLLMQYANLIRNRCEVLGDVSERKVRSPEAETDLSEVG